jgi:zona occludens toxin (predicted ATPase)
MVKFFSGTPGSGKSFHTAREISEKLKRRRNVISTVDINIDVISRNGRKRIGDFVYVPITEINTKYLYQYAMKNHRKAKEGQTLLVIDECQIIFNTRDFQGKEQNKKRVDWILFFSRHRHLGYDVILISQQDRMIDRQIRGMFEYEYKHRKVNNFLWFLPITFFVCVQYWYGCRIRIGSEFIRYKRKIAKIYDSYTMYDDYIKEFEEIENEYKEESQPAEEPEAAPLAHAGGGRGSPPEGVRGRLPLLRRAWGFFTNPLKNAPLKS